MGRRVKATIEEDLRYPYLLEVPQRLVKEREYWIYRITDELSQWLVNSCELPYRVIQPTIVEGSFGNTQCWIRFMSKNDAILFKMTWA